MNSLVGYGSSDDEEHGTDRPVERVVEAAETAPPPREQPERTETATVIATATASPLPVVAPAAATTGPSVGPALATTSEHEDGPPLSPYTLERQRIRELTMPPVPDFAIPDPPPPPAANSEEAAALAATTAKFARFLELKRKGVHFHERLRTSSALRNPALLPRLMDFAGIDTESGHASSLGPHAAVSVRWPEECYADALLRRNEKTEKRRLAERARIDFAPASDAAGTSTSDAR